MKHHTMLLLALVGAAAGAYALSVYGRAVIAGKGAGDIGDKAAADLAASLSFTDALVAGARVLVGKNPFANPGDVYTVRESGSVASPERWTP